MLKAVSVVRSSPLQCDGYQTVSPCIAGSNKIQFLSHVRVCIHMSGLGKATTWLAETFGGEYPVAPMLQDPNPWALYKGAADGT